MSLFNKPWMKSIALFLAIFVFGAGLLIGGPIAAVIPCDEGLQIVVGPPSPGRFLVTGGSILFPFRALHPGAWVLGLASPGGTCTIVLVTTPLNGIVRMMGTSP